MPSIRANRLSLNQSMLMAACGEGSGERSYLTDTVAIRFGSTALNRFNEFRRDLYFRTL
jgi:hypothetical protein